MDRAEAYHRSSLRKHRKRLVTLLVVIGLLCLVIGGLFELVALSKMEHERSRFIRIGLYYVAAASAVLSIYFLAFALPDIIADRRSGVASRRRAVAKLYQRPKPGPGIIKRADDGSVLVIVLVLLGVISAAALHAIVTARGELRLASSRLEHGLLRVAAVDAARAAMQQIADDPDLLVDHLGEDWAQSREYVDPAGMTRMVRITDANRMFDLNNVPVDMTDHRLPPAEVLANIMVQCGEMTPGQIIQALRDWTDKDEGGPWESDFYLTKNPPLTAANRILYGWSELFRVEGWASSMLEPKPLLERGRPFERDLVDSVTVIPVARQRTIPVDINTAEQATLSGIFGIGSEGIVERILTTRKETPFRSLGFLVDLLGNARYADVSPYLDVKSDVFHIQATAYRDGRLARLDLIARRFEDGHVDAVQAVF